jgi:hypothetical protein
MEVFTHDKNPETRNLDVMIRGTYQELTHRYEQAKEMALSKAADILGVPEGELTIFGGRQPLEPLNEAAEGDKKRASRIAAGHRADGTFDYALNKRVKEKQAAAKVGSEPVRLFGRTFPIGRKPY